MISRTNLFGIAAPYLIVLTAPILTHAAEKPAESAATSAAIDPKLYGHMKWRNVGPARGGRSVAVAGIPGDPLTFYMGATGGGIWKTEDAGNTWNPISDGQIKTGSVGSIAVAESDPNVIYVGMGEACVRGNFSHGDGVYRSMDAGKSWKHVGLADTRQIGRVRVHPRNSDLVYVAALGHVFGPNEERGVFRSKDGGATWEKVLYVNEKTGAVDLVMDPTNPRILYAAFWQVQRTPYSLISGGEGSGLWKSTDGGDTWRLLTKDLPEGIKGRIGVAASGAKPGRVWAIVEAEEGGIFRSDDYGESWRKVNDDRQWLQRAWYYTHIFADPTDADTMYSLNVSFGKSTDGGKTFEMLWPPHSDNHDLWIDPQDNRRMINANDGGATLSFNGGQTWTRQDNQPTAQFYHVTVDNQYPYRLYGAQQDNSTVSISSRERPGPGNEFYDVGGGESGYIAVHPKDHNIVYAGNYGGFLTRYDHRTQMTRNVSVWPENPMGWGAAELKYRFQWTFPILFSPHDPDILYAAGNVVFKSTDEGQSWTPISPDLTTNDKSKQGPSGGPITGDNTSVEYYCTIFAVAESPLEKGLIWAGTDDGLIHVTRDGGKNWKNVTPLDAPKWGLVSIIEASPHEPGKAYAAVTAYKLDDFRPYLFRTDNYGESWTPIVNGIPADAFTRTIREDSNRKGLLYAGTEVGAYISFDDGKSWQSLQLNLPVVPITDMVVHRDDLAISTQGRSFWVLDDLTQLHQLDDKVATAAVHLYQPRPIISTMDRGLPITYYLKRKPEKLKLEFLDAKGEVIKTFENKKGKDKPEEEATPRRRRGAAADSAPCEEGCNRFDWDLRYPDAEEIKGAILWSGGTRGPRCAPGKYEVRLTVGETVLTQPFEVRKDPRLETSDGDLQKRFALQKDIRDRVDECHKAINRIREIKAQSKAAADRVAEFNGNEAVKDAAKALTEKLEAVENELIQSKSKSSQDPLNFPIKLNDKLAGLSGVVAGGEFPPTDQARTVFKDLSGKLDTQLSALKDIEQSDVPRFNKLIDEQKVPAIFKKKEEKKEDPGTPL